MAGYNTQLITIGVFSVIASAIIFVAAGQLPPKKERFLQKNTQPPEPSLHFFAYNKCSPACCNQSNYSCNSGCVCMSQAQRDALTTRGNNAATLAPDQL